MAKQSRGVYQLQSDFRWILTGTPLNTALSDLQGQLKFLELEPFVNRPSMWKELKQGRKTSYNIVISSSLVDPIEFLFRKLIIRHSKQQKYSGREELVTLPAKHSETITVDFTSEQREIYDRVVERARGCFERAIKSGTLSIVCCSMLLVVWWLMVINGD